MSSQASRWFDTGAPHRDDGGLPVLVLFPFAGGGAGFFRSWRAGLDGACEVWAARLPGRETRIREQPRRELEPLARELADALPAVDRPVVFGGHSLGASIAWALALELRRRGAPAPARIVLMGAGSPDRRDLRMPLHLFSDEALVAKLVEYDGTPAALLENKDLLDLLLPTIRADFALFETWPVPSEPALDVPLTVLAGRSDDAVKPVQVEGWRNWTTRECEIRWLPGGHFFVETARPQVLAAVRAVLSSLTQAGVGA